MKKLLFVTALLAMGTMAMGKAPASKDKAKADVEVKAEIVDDSLVITDIYGAPLLLDFGKIQKGSKEVRTKVLEYKVSATEAPNANLTLNLKLAGATQKQEITLTHKDQSLPDNNTIKAYVSLDSYTGAMESGKTEYRGKILGSINPEQVANATLGQYQTFTSIEVEVQ